MCLSIFGAEEEHGKSCASKVGSGDSVGDVQETIGGLQSR